MNNKELQLERKVADFKGQKYQQSMSISKDEARIILDWADKTWKYDNLIR